jgi:hypothetical protein
MLKRRVKLTLVAIILLGIVGFVPSQAVQAAGGCRYSGVLYVSTAAQLIHAINRANCDPADNTISLIGTNTIFGLNAINNNTNGPNGLPVIANAGKLVINGNNNYLYRDESGPKFRIFYVAAGANLTINQLTISLGESDGSGGGMYNAVGLLTLNGVTVSGNIGNAFGGGIYNLGTLVMNNSAVAGNNAGVGAGIFTHNQLTLNNTFVYSNAAVVQGGGIDANDPSGVTLQNNSRVYDNTAPKCPDISYLDGTSCG